VTATPWQAIAALVDPVRRALFEHVRSQRRPVTREEAAHAVTISRNLTAFHLDKLVEAGLLKARYEAPAEVPRGRGRTPKVYEPADASLTFTVPPRRYDLVGEILADVVAGAITDGEPDLAARCRQRAFAHGRAVATGAGEGDLPAVLADLGFEPTVDDSAGEVALTNCPFHDLASRQRELICGLNRDFIAGILDGLGLADRDAHLRPEPGHCCVRIR
jgi:predicted ArsR family transcriptional regulator